MGKNKKNNGWILSCEFAKIEAEMSKETATGFDGMGGLNKRFADNEISEREVALDAVYCEKQSENSEDEFQVIWRDGVFAEASAETADDFSDTKRLSERFQKDSSAEQAVPLDEVFRCTNTMDQTKGNIVDCFTLPLEVETGDVPEEIWQKSETTVEKQRMLSTAIAKSNSVAKSKEKGHLSVFAVAEKLIKCAQIIYYGGAIYYFNGACYEYVDLRRMVTLMKRFIDRETMLSLSSTKFVQEVHACIKLSEYIDADDQLDENGDGRYVTFNNGTVDILTGALYPHSPKFLTFFCLNADYIPDEDLDTPDWDGFLDRSVGNELAKTLVMEMLGYLISPFLSAKKFFVLGLASNSGKSLFANFLKKVIAQKNISNVPWDELSETFGLASLVGKVLNLSMDLPDVTISPKAVSRLKMATGLDTSEVNEKYERKFSYINRAKFVFGTNFPLKFKVQDDALLERLVFVPFMNSIPVFERDRELLNKLMQEKDAILTKAVFAARRLYDRDFLFSGEGVFREIGVGLAKANDEATEEFLFTCCVIEPESTIFTSTVDLYRAYTAFCDENRLQPLEQSRFSKEVSDISGITKKRGEAKKDGERYQPRGFHGISLKSMNRSHE